jgi:hypothetical protein
MREKIHKRSGQSMELSTALKQPVRMTVKHVMERITAEVVHSSSDADPGCLSRIPDPNFFHPGSASKNLSILTKKWFLISRKYDSGCPSRIRILTFNPFRIPDLGIKKAPDPGSGSATHTSISTAMFKAHHFPN